MGVAIGLVLGLAFGDVLGLVLGRTIGVKLDEELIVLFSILLHEEDGIAFGRRLV